MKFHSTKNQSELFTAEMAILQGLPKDNGLFIPESLPELSQSFWEQTHKMTLVEIATEISSVFLGDEISKKDLNRIIEKAINFDAPLYKLEDNIFCLELFHGPSMAFKDFGARFMAGVMSHFLKKENKSIHILVATSGDTGGAVAQGFYSYPNIKVHILYPSGKVSPIQEKQLTTLGENISALEVDGTFDDCQSLVKTAFLDSELNSKLNLASANSINIARLIPQAFYYAYAYSRLKDKYNEVVFSVPSGNFGNLSAGVLAQRLGMPNVRFIAATNMNKVVPEYLLSGEYSPIKPSLSTISNAMDVGNPSNFPRLMFLHNGQLDELRSNVKGFHLNDEETRKAMFLLYEKYKYIVCPHTAIGYQALVDLENLEDQSTGFVFLSTAHYAKFLEEVSLVVDFEPTIPKRLENLSSKEKVALKMDDSFESFKAYLSQFK